MSTHAAVPAKPVEIARLALRKMAELELAPTPENYADQYRRAGGLPAVDSSGSGNSLRGIEMESMLRGIVEMISQTAEELGGGLIQFGGEIQGMLGQVEHADSAEGVRGLLQALTVSALAMQEAVDASRSELARTNEQLQQVASELERTQTQARTDPLTGLLNRRGMDEVLGREIARARRVTAPVSVALLDIDHFKQLNDEHGHDVGDRALVHLATLAKSAFRETDSFCRYGGEEFVVLLPGAGGEGAHFVIDRMRALTEKSPLITGTDKLTIRFSAGVAELGPNETAAAILKRADQALYEAKRTGRNRVVISAAVQVA